jgi:molybdate/tungstate transport system substrate-binding protein
VLTATYLGVKGVHLFCRSYTNLINPATGVRPLPQYPSEIDTKYNEGMSIFHALQINVNRRFHNGLFLAGNFMYSHALNDGMLNRHRESSTIIVIMKQNRTSLSRRHLLKRGNSFIAGAIAIGSFPRLLAEQLDVLDVAAAGSMRAMLDGPLKIAAAQTLMLDLHSHAQGADAVAHSLVDGSLRADVFIPITPGPMRTVMQAGKAEVAYPIARTEMVLLYSPKSRFAPQFDAAAAGKANWWEILQEPDLRFARGNPAGDPGDRNAFFLMMLAAKKYGHPEVVERLFGSTVKPPPRVVGVSNQVKLQTGELDASTSYRVATSFGNLPYIALPKDINLSGDMVAAEHPDVRLSIDGKTFYPEPLVFYAAVLKEAANPKGGAAFVDWLKSGEAQRLLRKHQYDSPGVANILQAQKETPQAR